MAGEHSNEAEHMAESGLSGAFLDELYTVIESRRSSDPERSHTAKLFERGVPKIAQKLGEEAVETLIEGMRGRRKELAAESADLLYHLLVLWAACGVKPESVWQALAERKGVSGVVEKARRNSE
jgi:phosphoribosyl-ATP pyrophosphohydrolase